MHEEIEHVRKGKHGARSTKQAIGIGLSKARRAGVAVPAKKGSAAKKPGLPSRPVRHGLGSLFRQLKHFYIIGIAHHKRLARRSGNRPVKLLISFYSSARSIPCIQKIHQVSERWND